jgi:hypothetical protein
MLWVGGNILERCSALLKEQLIKKLLFSANEISQRLRDGECDHKISDRQQTRALILNPAACTVMTALRAGSISTTMPRKMMLSASAAMIETPSLGWRVAL